MRNPSRARYTDSFRGTPPTSKNIKTHYILNKNARLTPNSCVFYDLRTFVAKFCRFIYALFPQIFGD